MSNEKVELVIICPHCQDLVLIEQLNCKIFRHAILKTTGEQINPHASKLECDYYVTNNLIYGCGKPFRIVINDNTFIPVKCDYI